MKGKKIIVILMIFLIQVAAQFRRQPKFRAQLEKQVKQLAENFFYLYPHIQKTKTTDLSCNYFCQGVNCSSCSCTEQSCDICFPHSQGNTCTQCDQVQCKVCTKECICTSCLAENPLSCTYSQQQQCIPKSPDMNSITQALTLQKISETNQREIGSIIYNYLLKVNASKNNYSEADNKQNNNLTYSTSQFQILKEKKNIPEMSSFNQTTCPILCEFFGNCEECICENQECLFNIQIEKIQFRVSFYQQSGIFYGNSYDDCLFFLKSSKQTVFYHSNNYYEQCQDSILSKIRQIKAKGPSKRSEKTLIALYEFYFSKNFDQKTNCNAQKCTIQGQVYLSNQRNEIKYECSSKNQTCEGCISFYCLRCDRDGSCQGQFV